MAGIQYLLVASQLLSIEVKAIGDDRSLILSVAGARTRLLGPRRRHLLSRRRV